MWRTQLGEKRERETSPFTFSIDITTTRWKRWTRSERRVAARKGQKPIPPPPRRKMKLTRKRNRCLFGFFFDSKPFRRWIERSRTIYNNELMTFVFQTETTSRKSTGETGHSFQKVQFNDQRDFFLCVSPFSSSDTEITFWLVTLRQRREIREKTKRLF